MAKIRTAHGVKGLVKLDFYGEDPDVLMSYNPLLDHTGTREFILMRLTKHKDFYLAAFENIKDRTAAEAVRGTELYVPRDKLPQIEEDNTYYHIDMIGCAVVQDGKKIGTVASVQNFGGGDMLEIDRDQGQNFYLPFINDYVPDVDIATKTITITPPDGLVELK